MGREARARAHARPIPRSTRTRLEALRLLPPPITRPVITPRLSRTGRFAAFVAGLLTPRKDRRP